METRKPMSFSLGKAIYFYKLFKSWQSERKASMQKKSEEWIIVPWRRSDPREIHREKRDAAEILTPRTPFGMPCVGVAVIGAARLPSFFRASKKAAPTPALRLTGAAN
jgi:hypothetical protein